MNIQGYDNWKTQSDLDYLGSNDRDIDYEDLHNVVIKGRFDSEDAMIVSADYYDLELTEEELEEANSCFGRVENYFAKKGTILR